MKKGLVLLLSVASALAQSVIDYSKLPDCAHSCSVLQQAESNCVPPAAPVTSQAIYQSCVCQSSLLTTLHSSGAQCTATGCSADDAAKIYQYYVALCAGPVVTPTSTTSTATSTSASATSGTLTATASGAAANGVTSTSHNNGWFHTHWKWVVMVIIVFLAIVFFWVGGIFLRRHIHRKHEAARANMAAHDAPYVAPDPSTSGSKAALSKDTPPTPQMAMSGGRSGMMMDGGIGGIAPPRGPQRVRSRSNTLRSLTQGNSSRTQLPEPVVWGPHQHQAFANRHQANGSPGPSGRPSGRPSGPPSPTSAISPPTPFRNREAMTSDPRFVQYKATPTAISVADKSVSQGTPSSSNWNAEAAGRDITRPHTAHTATGLSDSSNGRIGQVPNAMRSDPMLNPRVEPQSAEFCEPSPKKSGKLTKMPE